MRDVKYDNWRGDGRVDVTEGIFRVGGGWSEQVGLICRGRGGAGVEEKISRFEKNSRCCHLWVRVYKPHLTVE